MPAQLTLLGYDEQLVLAPSSADEEHASADEILVTPGQLQLFIAPVIVAALKSGGMASSDIGEAGESMFEGSCRAYGLPLHKAGRGQVGPDYFVNRWGVQVKATGKIRRDGYMVFGAGSGKRFLDYAGHVDAFAFVYVGLESDHYGRSLVLTADAVFSRWRGRSAAMRPIELRRTPDLSMLATTRE